MTCALHKGIESEEINRVKNSTVEFA